jgi:hypothetical protein
VRLAVLGLAAEVARLRSVLAEVVELVKLVAVVELAALHGS